jgi:hypothetical protein
MLNNPAPGNPKPPLRSGEVLSSSMEALLHRMNFTGHISVQIQNGRVLNSGYEEGYFRQRPGR